MRWFFLAGGAVMYGVGFMLPWISSLRGASFQQAILWDLLFLAVACGFGALASDDFDRVLSGATRGKWRPFRRRFVYAATGLIITLVATSAGYLHATVAL